MKTSIHADALGTFVPMLSMLSEILDRAAKHARKTKRTNAEILGAALTDDMMPLCAQVQIACANATDSTARLMGKKPPIFEEMRADGTVKDLRARIADAIEYLDSAPPDAFRGAEDRVVVMPLEDGLVLQMKGAQFLRDWGTPLFHFHVVTVFNILRSLGVDLSIRDFMAHVESSISRA